MGFRKIDRGKLRRLCANVELSDIQIAKRFGVTREAIRATRNLLGIKGRGRARVALLTQRRARREEKLRCRKFFKSRQALRRIRANATKLGIDFELLPKPHGRHMRIANAICHLIKGQFVEKAFRRRAHTFLGQLPHLYVPSRPRPLRAIKDLPIRRKLQNRNIAQSICPQPLRNQFRRFMKSCRPALPVKSRNPLQIPLRRLPAQFIR